MNHHNHHNSPDPISQKWLPVTITIPFKDLMKDEAREVTTYKMTKSRSNNKEFIHKEVNNKELMHKEDKQRV